MFMGEYSHTIDTKGRLIIPSKFREELGDEFVLTKGLDGCLSIYPMEQWKIFEKKLEALPLTNKNARKFSRFFVAGATTCELDRQGRILVPATMIWMRLQKICRKWELSSRSGEKRSKSVRWSLNTNRYY